MLHKFLKVSQILKKVFQKKLSDLHRLILNLHTLKQIQLPDEGSLSHVLF